MLALACFVGDEGTFEIFATELHKGRASNREAVDETKPRVAAASATLGTGESRSRNPDRVAESSNDWLPNVASGNVGMEGKTASRFLDFNHGTADPFCSK